MVEGRCHCGTALPDLYAFCLAGPFYYNYVLRRIRYGVTLAYTVCHGAVFPSRAARRIIVYPGRG